MATIFQSYRILFLLLDTYKSTKAKYIDVQSSRDAEEHDIILYYIRGKTIRNGNLQINELQVFQFFVADSDS